MARRTTKTRGAAVDVSSFAQGVTDPFDQPSGPSPAKEPRAPAGAVSLDATPIAPAALATALEALHSPAFIVAEPDIVLLANSRGRAVLTSSADEVLACLRGASSAFSLSPVRIPVDAVPGHHLVILRDREGEARSRLATVTPRWGLTPRQAGVLALVAQGESNRAVAGRLGCSEKTVELHVSALLAKTRCSSRSQLVARFWTE
jgi:DNA-binding CsgD family transcriptional regulator